MSDLTGVLEAADPALRAFAAAGAQARFAGGEAPGERALVLELVYEAYLLHYGEPRAFAGMNEDLRLLGGDDLYAAGLARLARAGDLEAVALLADLITACSRAHAEGRPDAAEREWSGSAARLTGP